MKATLIRLSLALSLGLAVYAAQAPTQAPGQVNINIATPAGRRGARGRGGFAGVRPNAVHTRILAAPAVIAAGKTAYDANCASCHATDLRGTDSGVNLLEDQIALLDEHGELITPVLRGEKTPLGTHPVSHLSSQQITEIAEYMHAVQATMQVQGRPPAGFAQPSNLALLVGSAPAGKAFFDAHCSICHQGDPGNLAGIGTKYPNIRTLQNTWVAGSASAGSFGRGGGGAGATITVTLDDGRVVTGSLLQENAFNVTLREANGTRISFDRGYNVKSVVVNNPAEAHKKMMRTMDDAELHDVTAYLHTLR